MLALCFQNNPSSDRAFVFPSHTVCLFCATESCFCHPSHHHHVLNLFWIFHVAFFIFVQNLTVCNCVAHCLKPFEMRIPSVFGLPASILLLIASHTIATPEEQSPEGWSQKRVEQRRDVEEHLRLGRSPVGVMKMSADEGEKFYMEYWQFEQDLEQSRMLDTTLRARDENEEARLLANASAAISFRPPFALHWDLGMGYGDLRARRAMEGVAVLAALQKRDFVCPTGTASCQAIGYPNSCCSTDENCFAIQDTGFGPVGCCPKGGSCGGTISVCNAPNTACSASLGGGCCIPNFVCEGVGCEYLAYN